jgi:hypothetical protein
MTLTSDYSQALIGQMKLAGHILFGRAKDRLDESTIPTEGILAMADKNTVRMIYKQQLIDADPFYWDSKLCLFLEQIAPKIPDWTLTIPSLPTESGFIWFDKPLVMPSVPTELDSSNEMCPLVAISWSTFGYKYMPGISNFVLFDSVTWEGVDQLWLIVGFYILHNGQPEPIGQCSLMDGESLSKFVNTHDVPEDHIELQHWFVRCFQYFASAVSFMEQNIIVSEKQRPNRNVRRHLPPFAKNEPLVRVVRLRRQERSINIANSHCDVDWQCQWLVKGHWRQQWYAKTMAHKPKYIMPYVKGPEDKPMKPPRPTIFAVVR